MYSKFIYVFQICLGVVFLASTLGKLREPRALAHGLRDYGIENEFLAAALLMVLTIVEGAIAFSHLTAIGMDTSIPIALALLSVLLLLVGRTLHNGKRVSCLCFGASNGELVSVRTVARLATMLIAECVLALSRALGYRAPDLSQDTLAEFARYALCSLLLLCFVGWLFNVAILIQFHKATVRGLSPRRTA